MSDPTATRPIFIAETSAAGTQTSTIQILLLAANPAATNPLRIDEEVRSIDQALFRSAHRDRFALNQHWAVRFRELQELLLRHKPSIVHFSGHGAHDQGIVLLDDAGDPWPVPGPQLANLFRIVGGVRCVVLNACYSDEQAKAIAPHVGAVVGMAGAISDGAAAEFASAFYQALGYGRSVQDAFDLGLAALDLAAISDDATPRLLCSQEGAVQLPLVDASVPGPRSSTSVATEPRLRVRQDMIKLMESIWIKGLLQPSLYGQLAMPMAVRSRPDLLDGPDPVAPLLEAGSPDHSAPLRPIDIFHASEHLLLVVGEPGSGKTTFILDVMRETLDEANGNPEYPIPVFLNLGTWHRRHEKLDGWIVQEIHLKYKVPNATVQTWLDDDALFLVLDGLDEVRNDMRLGCMEAIDAFRLDHWVPLIIAGRTSALAEIEKRPRVFGAVELQPLSQQQIVSYLTAVGVEPEQLARLLDQDVLTPAVAPTPLMLNLLLNAYQDSVRPQTAEQGSLELERATLGVFMERAMMRYSDTLPYHPARFRCQLHWIARKMTEQNQPILMVEDLQPSWFPDGNMRLAYQVLSLFVAALVVGAVFGIASWLWTLQELPHVRRALVAGFALSAASGMMFGLLRVRPIIGAAVSGSIFGLTLGYGYGVVFNAQTGIIVGLSGGILAALLFWAMARVLYQYSPQTWDWVLPTERLGWTLRHSMRYGLVGFVAGAALGGVLGYVTLPQMTVAAALSFGLATAALAAILSGIRPAGIRKRIAVNQAILDSIRNALLIGTATTIAVALPIAYLATTWNVLPVFYIPLPPAIAGALLGIALGSGFGVVAGLVFGGWAALQHIILRAQLSLTGNLPWNLARFLEWCTRMGIMRRVGGGHIFAHAFVQEYVANQSEWSNCRRELEEV